MKQKVMLDRLFTDHMVLQREKPIRLWGKCIGDEPVLVSFMGVTVNADVDGQFWSAILPPVKAARGQILKVSSGETQHTVMDVSVGEVWLAGGQSNMEFYMWYDANYSTVVESCDLSDIRFYDVPKVCYEGQEEDYDYSRMGFWRTCSKENLAYFSAAAYYFALKLSKELQVPVGIIGCNKGGSTVQSWMSKEALVKHGQVWIDEYEAEIAKVDYEAFKKSMRKSAQMDMGNPFDDAVSNKLLFGISAEEQRELMEKAPEEMLQQPVIHYDNRYSCYYDRMLCSIAGVSVRGVIWYQGESEVFHPECFPEIFEDMIECWRTLWKEWLPFYYVQLAPFQSWMACNGSIFPVIRDKQSKAAKKDDRLHMISSSDAGMRYDIHPKNKQPIGNRLALSALKYEYNKQVQADAPMGRRARAIDNDLYIDFEGDMDSLIVKGEKVLELQLFGEGYLKEQELSFDAADFIIKNRTLILRNVNPGGNRVKRIAFAEKDYYEVNLYGSNGLPAMPFSCDVEKSSK